MNKDLIKQVVDKIVNMEYGDTITHYEMADMLNLKSQERKYYDYVCRIKKLCLESGKMLENIWKVGYRIANPDDYSNLAIREYRNGARRISKGEKILNYAPVKDMSQEGLAEYRHVKDRSTALNAHLSGAIVELKLLKKKHPFSQSR